MPSKKITEKEEKEVIRLYSEKNSAPQIAHLLQGISVRQIYKCLERYGIMRRSTEENSAILLKNKPSTFSWKTNLSREEEHLQIAALMLYQGEGAKTRNTVDFANSDPLTIQLFLGFLRKIVRIDNSKLRFYLYCYSNQEIDEIIKFWCSYLKVEKQQFTQPYVRSSFNQGSRCMEFGLLHIRYSDKRLLLRILEECKLIMHSLI
jgi:hypothetical protein